MLTEDQRVNISQMIRSKSMHKLGMQQAKLQGYDVLHNWDYKVDYWYYKSGLDMYAENGMFRVKFNVSMHNVYVKYIHLSKEGDPIEGYKSLAAREYNLIHENNNHKPFKVVVFSDFMAFETLAEMHDYLFSDDELFNFVEIKDGKFDSIDGFKVRDYIFNVIRNNQTVFNKYIHKVPV